MGFPRPVDLLAWIPCLRRTAGMLALALLPASESAAGPPLGSDDPSAVRPRHLELVSSLTAFERGSKATVDATILDLSYGLVPTLELDFSWDVIATDHDKDDDGAFEHDGSPLTLGFKWEILRTEAFSIAFAPFGSLDPDDGDDLAGSLPVLVELRAGRFRTGADASFIALHDARNGWRLGTYAGFQVIPRMELLGEVAASAFRDRDDPSVEANLGFDLALEQRVHLLAAGGTGIRGGARSRREFRVFLGLQLLLGPFGDREVSASASQPGLLELTNRQVGSE